MGQITHPTLGSPMAMVSPDARLWVESTISGVPMVAISGGINIGSVHAEVDKIYVQSGVIFVDTREATENSYTPVTVLVYSGTVIGSIFENTNTGSVVQILGYDVSDNLTSIGSWVAI